ncbi:LacI family transcriptional regulator [Frankia canadensis]|uniref:LacI family transcriptional regulator n=1 Tax=Frankia canadensis TaxID=1836972 RepID=A0A2I2KVS0_9ACTN|nr:LacI family DNA-binding transcriptional regulator [Frankia canadensis]SNQ49761.1 LacI family transcriptional regulator [Frankia canadensis]SOU57051.1 LacI family transcriptional regulator [Frankia canadensis]
MKDVAQHANVSLSTVSYVLNDSGPVGKARRARVLDAVRVLGYTPNESARRLRTKSAATIGLIVPDLSNQFFALVAEGVESAAASRDALVVLCAPEAIDRTTEYYVRLLRSQSLDGLVYLPGGDGMTLNLALALAEAGPVVMVDERIRGFDVPSVVADSRSGARQIAEHVLSQGHRRIAIVGGPEALWTSEQRLAGYREALAGFRIPPKDVPHFVGDHREESGTRAAAQLLAESGADRPTALLCVNDLMAMGVYRYCREAGLRIPEDVSVAGFDDITVAGLLSPGLTTVRQPAREMGFQAANLLFDVIDGREATDDEMVLTLPTELIRRGSVSPPHPDDDEAPVQGIGA